MLSKNPSALSRLERTSRDITDAVTARLKELSANPQPHARFLNTLSLLEHVGSRKIMTSRAAGNFDQESLQHLAEETRHAFFLKRIAERVAGRALPYSREDAYALPSARMYMSRLDAHIAGALGGAQAGVLPYLYMSLIVELRAVWFYRLYQAALAETGAGFSLKSLLAEEEIHLERMQARVDGLDTQSDANLERFCAFEDRRFRVLWHSIEAAMKPGDMQPA